MAPDGTRWPILFLNTATLPPLGADTWIHAEIMRRLDRTAFEPIAACAFGTASQPTPTHEALRAIPDLELVAANLGPELSGRSRLGKLRGLLMTIPALWTIARLAWMIRRRDIRLVHTSDRPRDAAAAVLLSRLTRARSIVHVHVAYNPGWMGAMLRWALGRCDALIAISAFVGRTLSDGGLDPAKIHVVRNGIDVDRWHPETDGTAVRRELGAEATTPVLLTICRLFPEKGPGDAIEAVALVRDEFPDIRLLIVGTDVTGGWFSAQLHQRVAELGLDANVAFLGRRGDVEELLAACDVFVMPSFEEPFGLVFCEAMAMCRPVLALADGGTVEVVEDGRTGLLSERGDHAALAANLRALLVDPERRMAMGAAGRDVVESRFTTRRMAAQVGDVYQAVVSTTRDGDGLPDGRRGSSSMRVLEHTMDVESFRRALDEDGYVIIRDVVDRERLGALGADLTAEYDRLVAAKEMFEGGGSLTGHLNCFPGERSRFVWDEISKAGIPDLVRAIRPDIADSVRATMNFNLPGSVAQHYHTDGLYLKEFLICNIAVVDTDLRNGAIDVLPGSNRRFWKFWRYTLHRLWRKTTRVPLRQGDVIVRKSTLWHRGMPNLSPAPRPMMAITFGEMDDLDQDAFALNEGKAFFFPNWYNTSRLGLLREQMFVKAPLSYDAWRFARSLYGNKGYATW
jgi:glycosyltransferase involved in cell wall biosynthesis